MVSPPWRCWLRLLVPVQACFVSILRLTITGFAENCKCNAYFIGSCQRRQITWSVIAQITVTMAMSR